MYIYFEKRTRHVLLVSIRNMVLYNLFILQLFYIQNMFKRYRKYLCLLHMGHMKRSLKDFICIERVTFSNLISTRFILR